LKKKVKGLKSNIGKVQWSLIPFKVLKEVVKAFMHGNEKYSRDNWKVNVQENEYFYYDALMRHYEELHTKRFEENNQKLIIDRDSKLPTLAHIICNCLILLWHQLKRGEK
jgi:hypothetical protein